MSLSTIDRRSALRLLGVATSTTLAGCGTPLRTRLFGPPPVEIHGDSVPEEVPFQHRVRLVHEESEDRPLTIRISIVNDSETIARIATPHLSLPFVTPKDSFSLRGGSYVLSSRREDGRFDVCWEYAGAGGIRTAISAKRLQPREETGKTFYLYNSRDSGRCWPTGTYRFSQRYWYERPGDRQRGYSWGFTLDVKTIP